MKRQEQISKLRGGIPQLPISLQNQLLLLCFQFDERIHNLENIHYLPTKLVIILNRIIADWIKKFYYRCNKNTISSS